MLTQTLFHLSIWNIVIIIIWCAAGSFGVVGSLEYALFSASLCTNKSQLALVMIAMMAGAVMGDILVYFVALRLRRPFKALMKRTGAIRKARLILRMFKGALLPLTFLSRFLTLWLGVAVNYACGIQKVDFRKYLTASIAGEIVAGVLFPLLGYAFKESVTQLPSYIGRIVIIISALLLLALILLRIVPLYALIKGSKGNNSN